MPPKRVRLADRVAQDAPAPTAAPARASLWSAAPERQEVVTLDVTQIMPNPRQPRTVFDPDALAELAASIRTHGIIQPVIVQAIPLTKWDGHARRYEIIAGERRWRASILAEQPTIPALIRDAADDHTTLIELALIENLQRADLHPLEEARAFGTLRDELGYSIRRIAERIGKSKGYVENRLKLLDLDADLQQLVTERPDTLMHVSELAKVADPPQRAALVAAVADGLSYAETQARVRAAQPAAPAAQVSLYKDSHAPDQAGADAAFDPAAPSPAVHPSDTDDGRHDPHSTAVDHPSAPVAAPTRQALPEIQQALDGWLSDPARLTAADWALLESLAQRLRAILSQRESLLR